MDRERKGGEKDKTVSLLPERNKEKVENGFSPASPNPKMLNACLKLLLSTNQIHKPLYSTLNLLYTLFLWKHQKEKPKKKKKKPKKKLQKPREFRGRACGFGDLGLATSFVLASLLCNGCGGLFVFLFHFVQWPSCPYSQRGTLSLSISNSKVLFGFTQIWEQQYNVALSLRRKRQTGWSQAIYIYIYIYL